jgi:hypothetical protein
MQNQEHVFRPELSEAFTGSIRHLSLIKPFYLNLQPEYRVSSIEHRASSIEHRASGIELLNR